MSMLTLTNVRQINIIPSKFCGLLFQLLLVDLHLSFVDNVGFSERLLEDSYECVEVLFGVLWHYADSEPGLANLDYWVLNSVDVDS
jgi:hypothetical protein